jgi:hypothetical protein
VRTRPHLSYDNHLQIGNNKRIQNTTTEEGRLQHNTPQRLNREPEYALLLIAHVCKAMRFVVIFWHYFKCKHFFLVVVVSKTQHYVNLSVESRV